MKRAVLGFMVNVEDSRDLTKLQQSVIPHLEEAGAAVVSFSAAKEQQQFTVFAVVKGKPGQRIRLVVDADDEADAEAVATEQAGHPLSIAAVLSGALIGAEDGGDPE